MDRLKALLIATHPVASQDRNKNINTNDTREAERSALNTADARANRQVYQNEVRQANLYEQSTMPPTPQDVGVSFKIGSFVNKLSQLLSFKTDLYGQLQTLINLGQSPSRLLTDARLISISSDYFKMVEVIATYNELVNYISLYAPQMRASSDFANGVNTTYLLPMIALLKQTAQLYSSAFNNFPTGNLGPSKDREAYERFRKGSASGFATVMLMADNLTNAIYTGITRKQVDRYETNKQILSQVFAKNPLPVQPPPQPPQPLPIVPQPIQPGGQPAPLPVQPVQPVPAPAGQAGVMDLLRAYNAEQIQAGIQPPEVFNTRRLGNAGALINDILRLGQAQQPPFNPSGNAIKKGLPVIRAELIAQAQAQQGQQGGPAPAPVQPVPPAPPSPRVQAQFSPEQQAFQQAGGTFADRQGASTVIPELNQDESNEVWRIYKEFEIRRGDVIRPRLPDLRLLFAQLPQGLQDKLKKIGPPNLQGDEIPEDTAIQDSLVDWVRNIQQRRERFGQAQQPNVPSQDLYGQGQGQRQYLEDRRYLGELARENPRGVDMSQGRTKREKMMPFINEFDPKAEFLKRRGEIMAGGIEFGVNDNINDLVPYEVYGGNSQLDDHEEMSAFKRRIGMPNPFAPPRRVDTLPIRPVFASNATDIDESIVPYGDMFSGSRSGHEKEKAQYKDMDEDPDPIRITNENYKIFTGKQKAPKYKISS